LRVSQPQPTASKIMRFEVVEVGLEFDPNGRDFSETPIWKEEGIGPSQIASFAVRIVARYLRELRWYFGSNGSPSLCLEVHSE
jgi:hypothetical protein